MVMQTASKRRKPPTPTGSGLPRVDNAETKKNRDNPRFSSPHHQRNSILLQPRDRSASLTSRGSANASRASSGGNRSVTRSTRSSSSQGSKGSRGSRGSRRSISSPRFIGLGANVAKSFFPSKVEVMDYEYNHTAESIVQTVSSKESIATSEELSPSRSYTRAGSNGSSPNRSSISHQPQQRATFIPSNYIYGSSSTDPNVPTMEQQNGERNNIFNASRESVGTSGTRPEWNGSSINRPSISLQPQQNVPTMEQQNGERNKIFNAARESIGTSGTRPEWNGSSTNRSSISLQPQQRASSIPSNYNYGSVPKDSNMPMMEQQNGERNKIFNAGLVRRNTSNSTPLDYSGRGNISISMMEYSDHSHSVTNTIDQSNHSVDDVGSLDQKYPWKRDKILSPPPVYSPSQMVDSMQETPKQRNVKKIHRRSYSADAVDFALNEKKIRSPNVSLPHASPRNVHGSREPLLKVEQSLLPKTGVDVYHNPASRERAKSEVYLPNTTYPYRSHLGYSSPKSQINGPYKANIGEQEKLLDGDSDHSTQVSSLQNYSAKNTIPNRRSFRRLVFLIITEPQTSYASAVYYILLVIMIILSNAIMMMETMDAFQRTPSECIKCIGWNDDNDFHSDDLVNHTITPDHVDCVCAPVPNHLIVRAQDHVMMFLVIELCLRVLCFEPTPYDEDGYRRSFGSSLWEWFKFLGETSTILDFLATFPYYLERYEAAHGLLSLRLLRIFRVFQLIRLGQYHETFCSLVNVLIEFLVSLHMLVIAIIFGAAFFGCLIYGFEKGEWKYTDSISPPGYAHVRLSADGVTEEVSPFTSIPASFWWFIVTATTVGYGDMSPTTVGGKIIASFAMLTGVLVIAFPVSVFSDLWHKELERRGTLSRLTGPYSKDEDDSTIDEDRSREAPVPFISGHFDVNESKRDGRVFEDNDDLSVGSSVLGSSHSSSSHGIDSDPEILIQLPQKDVAAVHKYMKTIDKSQREIRNILSKMEKIA